MKSSCPVEETIWGVLIRNHAVPFCDQAHHIIGHYKPAIQNRRWFAKYPYGTEPSVP
jgi:hypothetical protein